jgi:hypothetical protein
MIPQIIISPPPLITQPITIHLYYNKKDNNLTVAKPTNTLTYTLHPNFWCIFWPVLYQTLTDTPNSSIIKIYLNKSPDLKIPSYINRMVKIPFSRFISECNILSISKSFTISWLNLKDHQPPLDILPRINTSVPECFPLTITSSPLINNTHATSVTHWIKFINYYTNLFDILLSESAIYKPSSFEELETIIRANHKLKKLDQLKHRALSTFRTKLLANQLPTRTKLHKRYPTHYPDNLCPRCDAFPEDLLHIFSCVHIRPLISKKKSKLENLILNLNPKSIKISDFISTLKLTPSTLLDLAIGKFNSSFSSLQKKEDISNYTLKILYKAWKLRSATATTSPASGIKWKKTPGSKAPNLNINDNTTFNKILNLLNSSLNFTDKSIFTPTIVSSF